MINKIKAVLFDMDGVLVDAREWHYEALNKALSYFGMEISRYDHLVSYDGLPTKRKLEMLTAERGLPEKLHDFINSLKQKFTTEITHTRCKPSFIHEYALSKLKSAGFTIAVCSNSIRATIELMMDKSNLTRYLDLIISSEDVCRPKPDPMIYNKAMEKLSLSPAECLILEDNKNGLKAAMDSGAYVLKVQTVQDVNYRAIQQTISFIESNPNAYRKSMMHSVKRKH